MLKGCACSIVSRLITRLIVAAGLTVGGTALAATPAADGRTALALGDSVAFGFIEQAGFAYVNPNNFVAYPYYDASPLRLDVTNAACPGETTGSFLSASAADNGCRSYRSTFPLHAAYPSTQLDFAVDYLEGHRQTRLVTIQLGANDVFLLEDACSGDPACIVAGLPGVLSAVGANLDRILRNLLATGYRGVVIVVDYYSPDYTNPQETGVTVALNQVLAAVATSHGAAIADAFSAFQSAASTPFAGGNTCRAGLLNADPQDPARCDVHPSQSGQQLLADVVRQTYLTALGGN